MIVIYSFKQSWYLLHFSLSPNHIHFPAFRTFYLGLSVESAEKSAAGTSVLGQSIINRRIHAVFKRFSLDALNYFCHAHIYTNFLPHIGQNFISQSAVAGGVTRYIVCIITELDNLCPFISQTALSVLSENCFILEIIGFPLSQYSHMITPHLTFCHISGNVQYLTHRHNHIHTDKCEANIFHPIYRTKCHLTNNGLLYL